MAEDEEWAPGAAQDPISRVFTISLAVHVISIRGETMQGKHGMPKPLGT